MEKRIQITELLREEKRGASILSTKKLACNQKELLLNAGHSLVEQNFISIEPLDFTLGNIPENIIFTSKNAAKMVLEKNPDIELKNIFCVGKKTANFLKERGLNVIESENYGFDLAEKIITHYGNEDFLFFCGRKRRNELPDYLRQNGINLTETEVYDTRLVLVKIDRIFDGVLFFSPSAVKSFCAVNDLRESIVFCIGNTTASEAENFTDKIIVAKKPTIENVLVQVVKHFGKN